MSWNAIVINIMHIFSLLFGEEEYATFTSFRSKEIGDWVRSQGLLSSSD